MDIRRDSSSYEKYYVSDIEDGEWLQYTIEVEKAGSYNVHLNIAAPTDTGKLSLIVNGKRLAPNAQIPVAENLKNWKSLEFKNVRLIKGVNKVRVYADKGGMNLKGLRFLGRLRAAK